MDQRTQDGCMAGCLTGYGWLAGWPVWLKIQRLSQALKSRLVIRVPVKRRCPPQIPSPDAALCVMRWQHVRFINRRWLAAFCTCHDIRDGDYH